MRETANAFRIICNRCGTECSVVHADAEGTFLTAQITAHEVWFSLPGGRGGIHWTDDDGQLNETRSTIYDSCKKCAAQAAQLIDEFYDDEYRLAATADREHAALLGETP